MERERQSRVMTKGIEEILQGQHMLYQLSRDHSFQQRLIEQEHMSHRHAGAHPDARALTRAVGAAPALALEVLEFEVQAGDVFLLCSDGIYQELTPAHWGKR